MKEQPRPTWRSNAPSGGLGAVFEHRAAPLKRLWMSMAVTFAGMLVEIAGGLLTGSVALLSDAGHMFADALSSVAIVAGAVVMAVTGWRWIDPLRFGFTEITIELRLRPALSGEAE